MKLVKPLIFASLLAAALFAQRPWQQMTLPTLEEVARNFRTPPREYGAIQPFASWNGPGATERLAADFDRLAANGMFIVNLSPGRGEPRYLSPEHMALVKFAVEQAAKRGMKLWLQDESDYPSGFAGGKISQLYPQLTMQGLDADMSVRVMPGQTITMPVPPDVLGALAVFESTGTTIPVALDSSNLRWRAPAPPQGATGYPKPWQLMFVRHVFRSSPTRNFNREDGTRAKDSQYSLIDYLNPDATRAFLKVTHETYKSAVGDAFGKTILGFFGDEPDYTCFLPWTPRLPELFRERKGYDLIPYLPGLFAPKMTDETRRVRADYFDVWSGIFRDSFFGEQAEWARQNNVEYLVHLNHEEQGMRPDLPEDLTRNEGDFFRDMRHVQVPGIDNLNQLIPSAVHTPDGAWKVNNNFPKLASSAAHLFGRPKVWSEEGGGLGVDGKFQLDYQLVRGVNAMQVRVPVIRGPGGEGNATPAAAAAAVPPEAGMLAWYTNRAGYLMSIGRPAAQVGLYHPVTSLWMGDEEADRSATKLGWQLLEHQIDWDYFDEQSLSSVATIDGGGFRNQSGQVYKAIIVPSSIVITQSGLERFRAFVKAGGRLFFVGRTPNMVVGKTFLQASGSPDLSFATLIEPSGDITDKVFAALPRPDVSLDAPFKRLTYTHRNWRDADMYFFFNESDRAESRTATIAGHGEAQAWDLNTGEIHPMPGVVSQGDAMRIPLALAPYEARVIVVGPRAPNAGAAEPAWGRGTSVAQVAGDWSSTGASSYRKQLDIAADPAGKRTFLEIEGLRDYAQVRVNGKQLEAHAWQPYRWEVTGVVKRGANDFDLEVHRTEGGRGGRGAPSVLSTPGEVRITSY